MTDSTPRIFDFREIAALDDAAIAFRNWIGKSSSFFSDFWGDVSDYAVQLKLGNITTSSYGNAIESLSRDVNFCLVDFVDYAPSMLYASNRDFRTIACAMLGLDNDVTSSDESDAEQGDDEQSDDDADQENAKTQDIPDDELSPVEYSLAQLFLEQAAIALCDGWMGEESIGLKVNALELDPRKARFFREKDLVTCTSLQVVLKSGTVNLNWLVSKQKTCDLLESSVDQRDDGAPPAEPQMPPAHLISRLPIDVVSVLGQATLPMANLSKLEVGQLIELDQRIDLPVTSFVNDSPFYEGWPGRRGKNQAIEITRCLHG